jgi:CRISPR-associated protein Cmr3
MQTVAFKPLDTFFFRDGKPFDMGEDNWAEGQFIPFPSVFYGAIRSAYFAANTNEIVSIGKQSDPTASFQITGVFLAKSGNLFIPTPLDLVREKDNPEGRLFPVSLINKNETQCYSGYPYDLIPYNERDVVSMPESFISLDVLNRSRIKFYELDYFAQNEPKIGVGLDRSTRAGKKGKLFRVGLTRFQNKYNYKEKETDEAYFVVSYQGLAPFQAKLVKLGAEGKMARMESTPPISLLQLTDEAKQSKFFKVLLLTPAIFSNGSLPQLEKLLPDIEIKPRVSFVGKPKAIGGWDMLNNKPKEMSKAVPAGSVYYYEIASKHTLSDVLNTLSRVISISEGSEEQNKSGFGLYTLASWDPNKK